MQFASLFAGLAGRCVLTAWQGKAVGAVRGVFFALLGVWGGRGGTVV